MTKRHFATYFHSLAALILLAAGAALFSAPSLILDALHHARSLGAGEQLLARQAGAGLLLAGALNLLAVRSAMPRRTLHAVVLCYLVLFVAAHGASFALWWLWLAVALYALPLIPLPVPRLPTANGEQRGQIKWFNARKGFGFIVTEDSREIFIHFRALRNGGRQSLRPGTRVRFQVRQTERGDQADAVYIEE